MDYNRETEHAALLASWLAACPMPSVLAAAMDEYGREMFRRGRDGRQGDTFEAWLHQRARQPVRTFRVVGARAELTTMEG